MDGRGRTEVLEFAIEVFGPDRLMFGSDWPVAELGGGYAKVTAGLFTLIGQLHPAGRDAILGGTARRFYALGSDTTPKPTFTSAWTPDRRAVTPRTS